MVMAMGSETIAADDMAQAKREFSIRSLLLAGTMALMLSACGVSEDEQGEGDAATDPAIASALEEDLLVDPDLAESSNQNNALDPQGANKGAVPVTAADRKAATEAALAALGSKGIMAAPKPRKATDEDCKDCEGNRSGVTLAAKAQMQRTGQKAAGTCGNNLKYDAKWATRMPKEFNIYPKANVREAAGVENGKCDLRAVSFTSAATMKDVADFYFTKAKRGGFSTEYLVRDDGYHILGGIRGVDDAAYIVFMRTLRGGATEVEIVATNGR